jgi:lipid-binding SYLF domain-containing protein
MQTLKPKRLTWTAAGLMMIAAFLVGPATVAAKSNDERKAEIRTMRDEVLAELYKERPETKRKIEAAEGYAVFSNVGINVIFASVGGGRGVVVDKKGKETFMRMGTAGLGLGIGVKDFRGVFIFWSREKMDFFIEHGWDFSGQADLVAKSDDKGGQLAVAENLGKDVELYQFTKNGLAAQATLQGTKYWRDRRLD